MATILWSTLVDGSTPAFDPATDVLRFDSTSISASDFGMLTWTGSDVIFSVTGKSDPALNKTVHFTIAGGGRALTDSNVTYDNGSKLLIGDNTQSIGDGTSTFDDAADSLTGTAGGDRFIGLGGDDTLSGLGGNDVFVLNNGPNAFGSDTVDGGTGLGDAIGVGNHASILHGSTVDFGTHMVTSVDGTASFTNIESAFGTPLADTFIAIDTSRVLTGLGASNGNFDYALILRGYAGNDSFTGDSRHGYFELLTYTDAPNGVVVNLATGVASDGYDSDLVTPGLQPYTDTLVNIDAVQGSAFDDVLTAGGTGTTSFNGFYFEQLEGMAGNDTLDTNGASVVRAEYLNSPAGVTVNLATGTASDGWGTTDTLVGTFLGARGSNFSDVIVGDANNNFLEGRGGNDFIDGGAGTDSIYYVAATSAISIDLALGTSSITGGQGTDTWVNIEGVRGGDFNDTLLGADGVDNVLEGRAGADLIDGRSGTDLARYDYSLNAVNVNLATGTALDGYDSDLVTSGIQSYTDTLVSIERVRGSKFDDTLTGNSEDNGFEGWAGNDTIDGGMGEDTAEYRFSPSAVTVNLAAGTASDGWGGTDTLTSIEHVVGSAFNDTLTGGADSNILTGGSGADSLDGGTGLDAAAYREASSGVKVDLFNPANNTGEAAGDTFISIEGIIGSAFNDTLTGDAGSNFLRGGPGADVLNGGQGFFDFADYRGATAAVTVDLGNSANNTGEAAGDTFKSFSIEGIIGSAFNDTLIGDAFDNYLRGGPGADVLNGGAQLDFADYRGATSAVRADLSNPANNTGEAAGDTYISIERLAGSDFNDTLIGDAGENYFRGGLGADLLIGGAGFDLADYLWATTALTVDLGNPANNTGEAAGDTFVGIEALRGGDFNDTLIGDAGGNALRGGLGADLLNGGAGVDTVEYRNAETAVTVDLSNPANNTGEAAGDTFVSIENIRAGNYNDTLIGDAGNNTMLGVAGDDLLDGGLGSDVLQGGPGNDTLLGGAGNDGLDGNTGVDTMLGGIGNDSYTVDNVGDQVIENSGEGQDIVRASISWTLGANVEGLQLIGLNAINGTGNDLNNSMIGNSAANLLEGGLGIDMLTGGAGADVFRFASALGPTNIDSIRDFSLVDDTIQLENGVFTSLVTPGPLAAGSFVSGAGLSTSADTSPSGADDYLIYDTTGGKLYYDADGNGSGASQQFATLTGAPTGLTNADFLVV